MISSSRPWRSRLQRVPQANVTWTETRHSEASHQRCRRCGRGRGRPVHAGHPQRPKTKSLSRDLARDEGPGGQGPRRADCSPPNIRAARPSISNLGMYGIEQFAAIINPPQATILAVGAAIERPCRVNGADRCLRTEMTCTLSCDHRAVDGAVGAELLSAFRLFIEEPSLMLA